MTCKKERNIKTSILKLPKSNLFSTYINPSMSSKYICKILYVHTPMLWVAALRVHVCANRIARIPLPLQQQTFRYESKQRIHIQNIDIEETSSLKKPSYFLMPHNVRALESIFKGTGKIYLNITTNKK